jgi:hypothetical protein
MDDYQKNFNEHIYREELSWLKERRTQAKLRNINQKNTSAISLSGGGIRSATFNLGALQALEKHKQLARFDYLSTVSGGGYIASSLTWFKSRFAQQFPFGTERKDHSKVAGSVLSWLRSHSNFLTPGNGINKISLLTALLTGTLINLLIMMPLFIFIIYALTLDMPFIQSTISANSIITGFHLINGLGASIITLSFLFMLFTALSTSNGSTSGSRLTEKLRRCVSVLFSWGGLLLGIGFIPLYYHYFEIFSDWLVHASVSLSIFGIAISLLGARLKQQKNSSSFLTTFVISLGLIFSSLGFFIVCYHIVKDWSGIAFELYPLLVFSCILALGCNINLVSMHGFYRNRLRDAFMPYQIPGDDNSETVDVSSWAQAQNCQLAKLTPSDMPYQLINCNIELWGSKQTKYRNRGCDSFTLSPLYCGAASTGYANTHHYMQGNMDLATACAISGAAVATNTRETRSKPLNFIMALLNLRLGCWLDNPKKVQDSHRLFYKPWWYLYMFRDMFGKGLNEKQAYVHLSDGGHFENLGIYELVRRKCKLIFAFDAGADPQYHFSDLARVTELIRVDFGAKITIDISPIIPKANKLSTRAWAIGEISYEEGSTAILVYIKACLVTSLSEDINGYQRKNPSFPHQSTADQFFDEEQFEAYRELGFQITHRLLKTELSLMTTACEHH